MKKTTATILALTLAGGLSAFAADPDEAPVNPATPTLAMFDSGNLVGTEVENPAGKPIADIEKFLIDENGQVEFVILGTGGFLDLGERLIPIPWDALTFTTRNNDEGEPMNVVMVDATKEMLAEAPTYKDGDFESLHGNSDTVYTYWGVERNVDKAVAAMKGAAEETKEAISEAVDKLNERLKENDASNSGAE